MHKIPVGVLGASGYAGRELCGLVAGHPQLTLAFATANERRGERARVRAPGTGAPVDVTQSTLSRDLHELRLARVPTDDGMRYVATGTAEDAEQGRLALEGLLPQLFDRIDGVGELIVLHTVPGGAQPVAAAFDAARMSDVLGTVAE